MPATATVTAYVALGSNLGDREANLRSALLMLDKLEGLRVRRVSTLFENPAVGGRTGAPPFLNAAAEVETSLGARELLHRLLQVERTLGRQRREKWAPREIDLDLLLYGDAVIDEPGLSVPHPLMHERLFVLKPLAEIAPHVPHPVCRKTIAELLENVLRAG
jgi:2-amino-4-hydroxy-6-hydroxymethyldihydropteridine diphosphokinase